eukprot:14638737-Alexandrium_andersonii.AAC.1
MLIRRGCHPNSLQGETPLSGAWNPQNAGILRIRHRAPGDAVIRAAPPERRAATEGIPDLRKSQSPGKDDVLSEPSETAALSRWDVALHS